MNKRARTRLVILTVVALTMLVFVMLWLTGGLAFLGINTSGAYSKTVADIANDKALVGEKVKVAGKVVPGSWDRKTDPMQFTIADENDETGKGPVIAVVYNGTTPSTFGDGVTAIITGTLQSGGKLNSNEMITKCPSKYESKQGATPIGDLVGNTNMVRKTTKATGFVVAGSIKAVGQGDRFIVAEKADGSGKTAGVVYEGALPSGMTDGSEVVMTGAMEADGKFVATNVSLEQSQK
ncbi:MAG: cytochrome c maturation protein CcmE [Coriobacteriales bacterium]|nr:cytochrome c maturation protein CcmE [Coriobacteriales bacterium]